MRTLGKLAPWDASLIAQTGLTFDLSTPQGKLVTSLMASLAEFEHDLLRERVTSGIAAAKACGQTFGRRPGYRPSDRHAPEVVRLSRFEKASQREIGPEARDLQDCRQRDPEEGNGARRRSVRILTDDSVRMLLVVQTAYEKLKVP